MSFRDESEALRHRLAEQDRALAALDGRVLGLGRLVAETEAEILQRTRSRARRSAARSIWRLVRNAVAFVAGVAGAIMVTGGGCLIVPATIDAFDEPDPVRLECEVTGTARRDVAPGARCEIVVTGQDAECGARVVCAGGEVAVAAGRCSLLPSTGGVSFWTDPQQEGRGAIVLSEPLARASITGPSGALQLRILKRR